MGDGRLTSAANSAAAVCFSRSHESSHREQRDDRLEFKEPGVEPHYGPDRAVAIEHIDVRLSIEPEAATFKGEAWIRFRPLPGFDGGVVFDLDEVQVDACRDLEGHDLPFTHQDAELRIRVTRT